jgi:putative oxidoreductase
MNIRNVYSQGTDLLSKAKDAPLLLLRLILAYTFFGPAMLKLSDISATADFFAYLGIPLPTLNAYMAASTEMLGAVLLTLGLLTRFISLPLLMIMFVAIATVHGANGFHAIVPDISWEDAFVNGEAVKGTLVILQNGYEFVLYYIAMLLVLVTNGAGRLSLDHLIFHKS